MRVIASQSWRAYPVPMAAYIFRLLAIVSVLLMPGAMAVAPAAAHAAPAASKASHCSGHEEQKQEQVPASAMEMNCMACAALPAAVAPAAAEAALPAAPRLLALAFEADGIVPEIATPPPKLA